MKNESIMTRKQPFLLLILCLGFFLRIYRFTEIPPGLHVDEAAAGYNAFSLLQTGSDLWGTRLPVYLFNWGVGQNALYSYLSIPIVAILGLSSFTIRLLSLVAGILVLPLLYVTVKRMAGKDVAIISMLLLAIMPWHVMYSRWGLDSTLFPFFLLLGLNLVHRALDRAMSPILALVPWGISLYAYAVGYALVPLLLVLIFVIRRKVILEQWQRWFFGLALFCLLFVPIALFLIKNYVVHTVLPIESSLPFGMPLLALSRLEYASKGAPYDRLLNNLAFIFTGFQDGEPQDSIIGMPSTFIVLFPLTLIGAVLSIRRYRAWRRVDLFSVWLAACLPLFFLLNLTITRINAIFIPMLVVGVEGLLALHRALGTRRLRQRTFTIGVGALVTLQAIVFVTSYFLIYPFQPETEWVFPRGLDRALSKGLATASPAENILITASIPWPDMFVAFYTSYPAQKYRREISYTFYWGGVNVHSIGRFYFGIDNLPNPKDPFTYVLTKWDEDPCAIPSVFLETRLWKVGHCN